MQASQIDPSKIYALNVYEPKTSSTDQRTYVARFKVESVESHMRRHVLKPTSANYSHKVHGRIDERDVPPDLLPPEGEERQKYLKRSVDPAAIEDEYTKYQELVTRAVAETEKRKAAEAQRQNRAEQLVAMFYQLTGLPGLGDTKSSDRSFETSYQGRVNIGEQGVAALLKMLETTGIIMLALTSNQDSADKASNQQP